MGDTGSTALFYASEPRFAIDGQDDESLGPGVLSVAVEETVAGLYSCEVTFGNWGAINGSVGFLFFDRTTLEFGKRITVTLGDGDAGGQVFDGRISALQGRYPLERPAEILVLAEDRLQDLRMTRRTRTFEQTTDADVIRQIAGDHSLTPTVDLQGPTHAVIAQLNQSDLAFIRERARANDAEVWVDGTTLHVKPRPSRQSTPVTVTWGEGLLECAVGADLATQRSSLAVSGWDVAAKAAINVTAGASAIQPELGSGPAGGRVLEDTLGARTERLVHLAPSTTPEAQACADAQFRSLARRFVSGRAVAIGDARIRVGARVDLQGIGALFEGEYYVAEARHTFDRTWGYRTHFAVERPWIGQP